jgi:hypothetical protein
VAREIKRRGIPGRKIGTRLLLEAKACEAVFGFGDPSAAPTVRPATEKLRRMRRFVA